MSKMNPGLASFRAHHTSAWSHLKQSIGEWQRRVRSRQELMNLSDTGLRDIGLSRCDAVCEWSKPFWLV